MALVCPSKATEDNLIGLAIGSEEKALLVRAESDLNSAAFGNEDPIDINGGLYAKKAKWIAHVALQEQDP